MIQLNNKQKLYQSFKITNEGLLVNLDKIISGMEKLFDYFINDRTQSKIFSNREYMDIYTLCYDVCTKRENNDIMYTKIIYEIYQMGLLEYFSLIQIKLNNNYSKSYKKDSSRNKKLSHPPHAYCSLSVPDGLLGLMSGHLRAYQARRWDGESTFKRP